jgi:hypothetical protein
LKINFNITFPNLSTSSNWSLLRFPNQNPVHSVQQKSIGQKFCKSGTGRWMRAGSSLRKQTMSARVPLSAYYHVA